MASCPRPSSLTSLSDIRYVRRMSSPIPVAFRGSSPISSGASSYSGRRSSLAEISFRDRPRRLSLVENFSPRSVSDGRKLSLVESSTPTNSYESSVEIDTSSLSYDLVSSPRCGTSCAGSYQPIPHDQLPESAIRGSPTLFNLISASRSDIYIHSFI